MVSAPEYWSLIHGERERLVETLGHLSKDQWHAPTLCEGWDVEHVVAHLTAAANMNIWSWLQSMTFSGFDVAKHNARGIAKYRGRTQEETFENFGQSVNLTIAPTKDYAAWLGEVTVHGQDIAYYLGLELTPAPAAVHEVAKFFATKDFAVNSRTLIRGLKFQATDTEFVTGDGPLVSGPLLSLVMVMAGRGEFITKLSGDGLPELKQRLD